MLKLSVSTDQRAPAGAAVKRTLQQALSLHQRGRLSDAERLYIEVLEQAPTSFDAHHLLGVLALQSRQTEWGVELLTVAIRLNPNFAATHNNLGMGLNELGRHEEALASCDRAIALKPDFAEAYNNRGNALNSLKRHVEALASYEKAISLKPDYRRAQHNRESALADLSQWRLLRWYMAAIGVLPRLFPPITFNERITHRIIYDRDPRLKILCDKVAARQFISDRVGSEYVVPMLGLWKHPREIAWNSLPKQFVLKPSHSCGSVAMINQLTDVEVGKLMAEAERWLRRDYFDVSREWGYRGIPRRVIAEPLLASLDGGQVPEFKVFAFAGQAALINVFVGRKYTAERREAWFDVSGRRVAIARTDLPGVRAARADFVLSERDRRDLVDVAEKVSEGFSFLRVDMYMTDQGIKIGELTPYASGGRCKWASGDLDEKMGRLWLGNFDMAAFQDYE